MASEMSEFFGNIAHEGEDELLEELDQLEGEAVEEQLEGLDAPQESRIQVLID